MTELKNDLLLRALLREPVPTHAASGSCGRPVAICPSIARFAQQAGDFMSVVPQPGACLRGHAAAAAALQAGCGDPVFGHPDGSRCAWVWACTLRRARAEVQAAGADGGRDPRPAAPDVEQTLGYVFEAVRTIRRELERQVPLIGFAGSPWTVATYMVEGRSSRDFATIKGLAAEDPDGAVNAAGHRGRDHDRLSERAD